MLELGLAWGFQKQSEPVLALGHERQPGSNAGQRPSKDPPTIALPPSHRPWAPIESSGKTSREGYDPGQSADVPKHVGHPQHNAQSNRGQDKNANNSTQ